MLVVTVKNDGLLFGDGFMIHFERTLRIPDDGKQYPLPPSLGHFPIKQVKDYADRVPETWAKHGGVFIPMYQREALWLRFVNLKGWQPKALKVAVGKINAVSGKPWDQALRDEEKDYMVVPPQPWLDGINAGEDTIRQFVAMPLGMGYTVEGQITGEERFGGIQVIVYEAKPGVFPDEPAEHDRFFRQSMMFCAAESSASKAVWARAKSGGAEMGLGAGGKMKQKIYEDEHGIATWDVENYGRTYVHIVNSMMYREITGEEAPPTPVTAKLYAERGYPWFDVYDEHLTDIAAPDALKDVKSIKEMDAEKGFAPQQDDDPVDVPEDKIIKYGTQKEKDEIEDGEW
jgi:hypothetical protein